MKKRLLFTYIAIVFITLLASQMSFWTNGQRFLQEQSKEQYLNQAELIRDIFEEKSLSSDRDFDSFAKTYAKKQGVRITIIDMDGRVVAESEEDADKMENHKDREEVQEAMAGENASVIRRSHTLGIDYCYCAVPVRTESFEGVIRVSVPMQELENLKLEYTRSTLFILIIGILLISCLVMAD